MSNAIGRGDPVKQDKLIILMLSGACTVVIGLMLLTFLPSPAISKSPGKRCVAISKGEYNGARRDKLLHARVWRLCGNGVVLAALLLVLPLLARSDKRRNPNSVTACGRLAVDTVAQSHMGNQEFIFAYWAAIKVMARIDSDVPEGRQTAVFDPAARTKMVTLAMNRKITKAPRS